MKILLLPLLLVPVLAGAQEYQSPATVAKRLKAQCATVAPAQRAECESRARAETRASIDRHHQAKSGAAGKPPARALPAGTPRVERKGTQMTVPPRPAQK
jgi:hypothetical protein